MAKKTITVAQQQAEAMANGVSTGISVKEFMSGLANVNPDSNEVTLVSKPQVLLDGFTESDYDRYNRVVRTMSAASLVKEALNATVAAQISIVERHSLYKLEGYDTTAKWAEAMYGISKSYVSESLKVFKVLGNPEEADKLLPEWEGYKFSSLITIAGLTNDERKAIAEQIDPSMSRAKIKQVIGDYKQALVDKQEAIDHVKKRKVQTDGLMYELSKLMSQGEIVELVKSILPDYYEEGGFSTDSKYHADKESADKLYHGLDVKHKELLAEDAEDAQQEASTEESKVAQEPTTEESKTPETQQESSSEQFLKRPVIRVNRNAFKGDELFETVKELMALYDGAGADILITKYDYIALRDLKYSMPTELENWERAQRAQALNS